MHFFFIAGNLVISGQSPAQASVAPSPLRHEPQASIPIQQDMYAIQSVTDVKHETPEPAKHTLLAEARLPIVKLNRLNLDVRINLSQSVYPNFIDEFV